MTATPEHEFRLDPERPRDSDPTSDDPERFLFQSLHNPADSGRFALGTGMASLDGAPPPDKCQEFGEDLAWPSHGRSDTGLTPPRVGRERRIVVGSIINRVRPLRSEVHRVMSQESTSFAFNRDGPAAGTAGLIVFTRFPEPGKAKTRLIERLGAVGAAELQREMTLHTLAAARELRARRRVAVEVRFAGGDAVSMRACFGDDLAHRPQGDGDLGERMARAVGEALRDGMAAVVLIGSDCPGVTTDLLGRAFDLLCDDPDRVVVGPALDGGYYLIGMSRRRPELFQGIDWGTRNVLSQTVEAARRAGYPLRLLEPLADVDRPEDLDIWYSVRAGGPADRIARGTEAHLDPPNSATHRGEETSG